RRVLQANKALLAPEHDLIIAGSLMATKRENGSSDAIYLSLNPITMDAQNEWVYFGTVNGSVIYRLPASSLANDNLTDSQLSKTVEF
ncbi:hypothetical protein SB749_19825, partial [Brevibacterium sp. SIMBA_078]|uniref:hypothetical protein n=1 Tax=Brevibacterium sp. SIMBA_078 TaxID=3085816 RepID=UPI003979323C